MTVLGYKLLEKLAKNEINYDSKVDCEELFCKNCTIKFILAEEKIENILNAHFTILEENKEIEELKELNNSYDYDNLSVMLNRLKINELVREVNKLKKEN